MTQLTEHAKNVYLEENYQNNLDRSMNAVEKLKALGTEPTELFSEYENYKNLTNYSLMFAACVECLALGMELQKIINQ